MKPINHPPLPSFQASPSPTWRPGDVGATTTRKPSPATLRPEDGLAAKADGLDKNETTHSASKAGSAPLDLKLAGLALSGNSEATSVSLRGGNLLGNQALARDEVQKSRSDRKLAAKAAALAKANTPPTPAQVRARRLAEQAAAEKANVDYILNEEAEKDLAERTLSRMPLSTEISDGKIYKYAYNSSGKDSAGKAIGFESLGRKIQPGGFDPPLPAEIKAQGDHLRKEITEGVAKGPVVMRLTTRENVEKHGIYYNATVPVSGIGTKLGKQADLVTGWVDKRQPDGTTRGIAELATLIPKGEKK